LNVTMDYYLHDLQINGLKIFQRDDFFKFGTDAISLVNFANAKRADIALDIGTGTGVIPIILAGKFGVKRAIGIEIQTPLCKMADSSIKYNGLQERVTIVNLDAKLLNQRFASGFATLVTANPPYSKVGSGDVSHSSSIAISRFEQSLSLSQTIAAAKYSLSTGGRFCIVHKVERLAEVLTECSNAKLEPKRLKLLLPKLFLLECKKDAKVGLKIENS